MNDTSHISDDGNYIFIHVPKCAGRSVAKIFFEDRFSWKTFGGHWSAEYLQNSYSHKFSTYFKFAIVRNPYDRLVSAYHYFLTGRMKGLENFDNIDLNDALKLSDNFKDFCIRYFTHPRQAPIQGHLKTQSHWLVVDGKIGVDYLLKYENLEEGVNFLKEKLEYGKDEPLSVMNSTEHSDYMEYYDNDLLKIVNSFYQEDFSNFDYAKITNA